MRTHINSHPGSSTTGVHDEQAKGENSLRNIETNSKDSLGASNAQTGLLFGTMNSLTTPEAQIFAAGSQLEQHQDLQRHQFPIKQQHQQSALTATPNNSNNLFGSLNMPTNIITSNNNNNNAGNSVSNKVTTLTPPSIQATAPIDVQPPYDLVENNSANKAGECRQKRQEKSTDIEPTDLTPQQHSNTADQSKDRPSTVDSDKDDSKGDKKAKRKWRKRQSPSVTPTPDLVTKLPHLEAYDNGTLEQPRTSCPNKVFADFMAELHKNRLASAKSEIDKTSTSQTSLNESSSTKSNDSESKKRKRRPSSRKSPEKKLFEDPASTATDVPTAISNCTPCTANSSRTSNERLGLEGAVKIPPLSKPTPPKKAPSRSRPPRAPKSASTQPTPPRKKQPRRKASSEETGAKSKDSATSANLAKTPSVSEGTSQVSPLSINSHLPNAMHAPAGTSPLTINTPSLNNRLLQGVGSLEGQDMNRYFSPLISPYANFDHMNAPSLSRSSLSRLFTSSSADQIKDTSNLADDPSRAFEELRDNTWNHLSKCVLEQARDFDLPSLIGTLYVLRSENEKRVNRVRDLTMKRDQLIATNARLDLPGPMLTQHLNNTSPNFSSVVSGLTNSPKSLAHSRPGSAMGKQPMVSVGSYNHVTTGTLGPPSFLDRSSPIVNQMHSSMNNIKSSSISTPSPPIGALMAHSNSNRTGLITVNPPYMSNVFPAMNQLSSNQGSSYYPRQQS